MAYDLNIMGDPDNENTALAVDNTAIDGIVALTQRCMILLLTDSSVPENLGVGTTLPSYLKTVGNRPNNDELQNWFNIACQTVKNDLVSSQSQDLPADQKLADLDVTFAEGENDTAYIVIRVESEAGTTYEIKYPVDDIYKEQ
jgi:hypothetical protein